jgi:hypothetical protein
MIFGLLLFDHIREPTFYIQESEKKGEDRDRGR